jgi:hypothetical protein
LSTQGLTAAAGVQLLTPTLVLNVASITSALSTNAKSLSVAATSGAVAITDSQKATVIVNALSSTGAVSLTSGGAITTSATSDVSGSAITVTAGGTGAGNIIIGNNITSAAGTIDLNAAGKGTITESGKTTVVTAGTLNLVTQGGLIGASQTKPFVVDATTLSVNTGTSKTSSAFINNTAVAATIAASTVGSTFNYTGNITGASGPITASAVTLTLGTMSATLTTDAATLQGITAAGNLDITDTQTGLVKVNTATATVGQINITSGGAITTAGIISGSGAVVLTAGGTAGAITIGKNITSLTANVTLQATGTGAIIESSGLVAASPLTGTVTLKTAGGNIGSTTKSVTTNATTITLTGGATGNVYLTNKDSILAGSVLLSSTNVGSLKFTDTNTSAKNTGTLTINSIDAASGAITIATNEQAVVVAGASTIQTANGNITLQNTYAANGTNLPSISVGNATTIHGSSTGSTLTGNVFIALGTVPTASTIKAGTKPTGGTPPPVITGTVFFGTTSTPTGSIVTGSTDTLTGTGRNLSFTTGKNVAAQITLGSNVTIIADPPPGVATPAIVPTATIFSSSISPIVLTAPLAVPSVIAISVHESWQSLAQSINQNQAPPQLLSQQRPQILTQLLSQGQTQVIAGTNDSSSAAKLTGHVSTVSRQTMDSGASLYAPKQDTIIETPFGSVGIAKDSIAMVIASENGLAVYDLHDTHKNSIFIKCGPDQSNIALTPGHSAVLTHRDVETFEQINPAQKVSYKKLTGTPFDSEHTVYQGEFEIFSMIQSLGPLRDMIGSNDSVMRKTAGHMIKTAAILSQLTDSEPYRLFAVPEVTAELPAQQN